MVVATRTSRNNKTPIGVDLGIGGMRAVQLVRTAATYDVAAVALRTFPRTGQGTSTPAPETIRALLQQGSFHGKRVITALDLPALAYHALELPAALVADPDRDVDEVVRLEVGRLAEGPTDALHTSYWRLPPTQVSAPNTIGVALRRESVLELLNTCGRAGLNCVCVDSAATALCRFGALLRAWQPDELWGLLDLGGRETRLMLCLDDVPVLVRGAGSGGAAWTERIRDGLQVSSGAAEVHKCEHGIALTSRGVRPGNDAAPTHDQQSAFAPSPPRADAEWIAEAEHAAAPMMDGFTEVVSETRLDIRI